MMEWRSSLYKLQQIPQDEIQKKLLISYHALGDGNLKDVFLDIACFFIGEDKEMTISILDSCGFNSENEIIILKERCLLSINDKNELRMHDTLQDMGREIVKKESPKKPGKRSRLWSSEDICYVLEKEKGTKAIEGIIPCKGELEGVTLNTKTFERMPKLRLLDINDVHLTGNFEHVFEELRWLSWQGCNLQCLPSDFHPEKLVILDLKYSKINILWHGILFLEQLKILDLGYCRFMTTTPNFTRVPNLEKLLLGGCVSLAEIHPSIGQLSWLAYLDLRYCYILKELPEELGNIESLRELLASKSGIFKLPDSIGRLSRLVNLDLKSCRNLITLPNSLCNLRVLESLFVTDCENLKGLPEELGNIESLRVLSARYTAITKLPDSIGRLSRLVNLDLEYCRNLRTLPNSLCNLRVLESLFLNFCENLKGLPEELGNIESLRVLEARNTTITKLPDSIGRLTKLFALNLDFFKKLKNIPSCICKLPHRTLDLCNLNDNNPFDGFVLDNIGSLSSLESLYLSGNVFSTLPSNLSQLSNLKALDFQHCRNLGSLSKFPPNLEVLRGSGCTSMVRLPNLSNLKHLRELNLKNCSSLAEIQGLENLNSIEVIRLEGCNNLSISFTETFLQVYYGFGKQIDIYLPTRDIPDWFGHQILGPELNFSKICFDVLQNSENKFLGMILWVVSSDLPGLYARVKNKTNGNIWHKNAIYTEARSWVSFIPKTKIALKFGDKIEASIRRDDYFIMERFGVHCVYKTDTIEN